MSPGEALSVAAQIALALAGFAGVVVAFRSSAFHEWPLLDRHRLWLLLGNALVPLFACLFGMLLLTINPVPLSIWRWCSGCSLLLILGFTLLSQRRQAGLGPALVKEIGTYRYIFYLLMALGTAVGLIQVYNIVVAGVFWLFYAAILFQIAIGALQFARMIILPPHTSETSKQK